MALEDATNPMQGVSGPSAFSKRVDLAYQPDAYGDGVAYDANKGAAPLEKARKSPLLSEAPVVEANLKAAPLTELFAQSQYPERDIMYGNKVGPGPDNSILPGAKPVEKLSDTLAKMLPFDTDGSIAILYQDALARGN